MRGTGHDGCAGAMPRGRSSPQGGSAPSRNANAPSRLSSMPSRNTDVPSRLSSMPSRNANAPSRSASSGSAWRPDCASWASSLDGSHPIYRQGDIPTVQTVITGKAYVLGDNVDTDQIIPAQYLTFNPSIPEEYKQFGKYALSSVPASQAGLPKGHIPFHTDDEFVSPYKIIVAGKNFGC